MKALIYKIVISLDDLIERYELWQLSSDLDMFGVIDDDDD